MALASRTVAPTLLITARAARIGFKHSLELVRGVLPVSKRSLLDGPHHLHMSAALPELVDAIRQFVSARRAA